MEESFRAPLVRAGARLLRRRRDIVEELAPRLAAAFAEISGPGAPAAYLSYRPSGGPPPTGTEAELAGRLAELLEARLPRDLRARLLTCGPHMDDLLLGLGGRAGRGPTAARGSSGPSCWRCASPRWRTCAPSSRRPPLLLLDDVSCELDPEKNGFLLDYVAACRRRPSSPRPTGGSSSRWPGRRRSSSRCSRARSHRSVS